VIDDAIGMDYAAALGNEAKVQGEMSRAHDFAEGVAAFLQKACAGVSRSPDGRTDKTSLWGGLVDKAWVSPPKYSALLARGRADPGDLMTSPDAAASMHRSPIHRVLNHVSIRFKLGALAAISALVMVALSGWLVWQNYQAEVAGRQVAVRQNVETAASVLRWAQALEARGAVSRTQAQALALQALKGARYGGQEVTSGSTT